MSLVRSGFSVPVVCRGFSALLICGAVAVAQQGRVYTNADYAKAESRMRYKTDLLIDHSVEKVKWLPDGSFWYRDRTDGVTTFMLVNPKLGTKAPAFDNEAMAKALGVLLGATLDAKKLPVRKVLSKDKDSVVVKTHDSTYRCSLVGEMRCVAAGAQEDGAKGEPAVLSPDGKKSAFIRDWNLWVRDLHSGVETQLTKDGVKDYGYATDNAGWSHSDRAILVWSPDSKRIATFQQDQRKTGEMYLVKTQLGASAVGGVEVSATGRRGCDDDRTRCDRCRCEEGGAVEDGAGPASVDIMRRPDVQRYRGMG